MVSYHYRPVGNTRESETRVVSDPSDEKSAGLPGSEGVQCHPIAIWIRLHAIPRHLAKASHSLTMLSSEILKLDVSLHTSNYSCFLHVSRHLAQLASVSPRSSVFDVLVDTPRVSHLDPEFHSGVQSMEAERF